MFFCSLFLPIAHDTSMARNKISTTTGDQIAIKISKNEARKRKSHINEKSEQTATERNSYIKNMQNLRDSQTPEIAEGPIKSPPQELA